MLTTRFKGEFNVPELMDVIQEEGKDPKIIPSVKADKAETKHSMSVMDLGKLLLQFCKDGDTAKVHELMCRGAPFSTDWVRIKSFLCITYMSLFVFTFC